MVKVSVVIPTYNRGQSIQQAVDSALDQTIDSIEVIVVDDGSTDNTPDVMEKYNNEPKVSYIQHEHNYNGSVARNTGINVAKGQYIAFLDSDDVWECYKIERQLALISAESSAGAYCDVKRNRRKITSLLYRIVPDRTATPYDGNSDMARKILKRELDFGGCSTLIIKKDILDKIDGFDEGFERHQDIEFIIRVLEHGKVSFVNEELVLRSGWSTPNAELLKSEKKKLLTKYSELIIDMDMENENPIGKHKFNLATVYFKEGKFIEGARLLSKSSFAKPKSRELLSLGFHIFTGILKTLRS